MRKLRESCRKPRKSFPPFIKKLRDFSLEKIFFSFFLKLVFWGWEKKIAEKIFFGKFCFVWIYEKRYSVCIKMRQKSTKNFFFLSYIKKSWWFNKNLKLLIFFLTFDSNDCKFINIAILRKDFPLKGFFQKLMSRKRSSSNFFQWCFKIIIWNSSWLNIDLHLKQ